MVEASFFCNHLFRSGTEFFSGVPDSLLKNFCVYITDTVEADNHIVVANEGAAIALATGYHLATGKIPLVYMQNSGIGNAVNPLLSLADSEIYRIPMILLIGWRGEPGMKDEPQHIKQGKVTCDLLDVMGIPYSVMADTETELEEQFLVMYDHFSKFGSPYGLVVKKNTFSPQHDTQDSVFIEEDFPLSRESAIEEIIRISPLDELYVSTTGMASRELYELRDKLGLIHDTDFLTVGSMGHASQIALGVALQRPERLVTCLDGDGAVLMHMGSLAIIGNRKPRNFRHIILNNGAHDSVGGQPTVGLQMDLPSVACACGYEKVMSVRTADELRMALLETDKEKRHGPVLIEARICRGARKDLGRPRSSPIENKNAFMENFQ